MRLLTVIVTYNSAEYIAQCLGSIICHAASNEVIVFDNASVDDSAQIAEAHPLQPRVLRSDENLGFSRAVNLAASEAEFDYLLLVNPDTVIDDGAIDVLIEVANQHPEAGIFGGQSRDSLGKTFPGSVLAAHDLIHALKFAFCLGAIPFTGEMEPDALPGGEPRGTREVPAIVGCLMLIERSLWQLTGGLDESFFLYGEDVDFCMKSLAIGRKCLFTDRCRYLHIRGASSSGHAVMMKRVLRGRRQLYERYAGGRIGKSLLTIGVAARALAELMLGRRGTWRECWRDRSSWLAG